MTVRADPEPGPEPDANADAHGDPDPDPDADASAAPSKYGYGRSYGDSSHYGTGYRGGHGIQCHGINIAAGYGYRYRSRKCYCKARRSHYKNSYYYNQSCQYHYD